MQVVVSEEFFVLLVTQSRVNQDQSVAVLDQQAAHGPGTEVFLVGGIVLVPKYLRHDAKHGPAVEFEKSGIDGM